MWLLGDETAVDIKLVMQQPDRQDRSKRRVRKVDLKEDDWNYCGYENGEHKNEKFSYRNKSNVL
jgi:hypothetical protein